MKKLLIILLTLFSVNLYCCDCKTISKEKEYDNSNLVFLGKIISVNSKYFEVKVLEVFKGKPQPIIKSFISDCTIYPNKGDVWLLYSNRYDGNEFYISSCGNSRSFRVPFNHNSSTFPKPPPNIDNDLIGLFSDINYNVALLELNSDIQELRLIKTQKALNDINNNFINFKKQVAIFKWIIFLSIAIIGFIKYRTRFSKNL